jgi:hypothetical protein
MATVIISKRNIIIPSPDGRQAYPIPKEYIGSVPDWVTKTKYFKELVKDGKIAVSSTTKDNALEQADVEAKKAEQEAREKAKAAAEAEKAEQEAREKAKAAAEAEKAEQEAAEKSEETEKTERKKK